MEAFAASDVDARPEADRDVADVFNIDTSGPTHNDEPAASPPTKKKATQSKAAGVYHC